ncbi:Abi family protein [Acinetobacter sp. 10FS3-1]|uniref:Abi family protein n=1 Tax=Acinetobacter TaxID=469 RepID=UPI00109C7FF9|nr:Abi family protein [Acinetobacter sp. 10FS3-1]QKQ71937.1 Abi family protein [Acinetobacter sp. 10FS3-1]
MNKIRYSKKPNSINDLITKMASRGLDCSNHTLTQQSLKYIGYYRLRGYFYPFYKMDISQRKPKPIEPKSFVPNVKVEDILDLYEFDRKLRLIVLEEIQKVEVALRTCLSEYMSNKYNNAHWFMDMSIVSSEFKHEGLFQKIQDSKEQFIKHYQDKYDSPKYPPSWMITETLSFGTWSKVYKDLLSEDKKEIARAFNVPSADIMESWFHTLSHLRNLCAHHNRIWNRNFGVFFPRALDTLESHFTKKFTLYSRLVPLRHLSNNVSISNGMTERLQNLFNSAPSIVTLEKMGFSTDWDQSDLWKCH